LHCGTLCLGCVKTWLHRFTLNQKQNSTILSTTSKEQNKSRKEMRNSEKSATTINKCQWRSYRFETRGDLAEGAHLPILRKRWETIVNLDADVYTKTRNTGKHCEKRKKATTWWKPKNNKHRNINWMGTLILHLACKGVRLAPLLPVSDASAQGLVSNELETLLKAIAKKK